MMKLYLLFAVTLVAALFVGAVGYDFFRSRNQKSAIERAFNAQEIQLKAITYGGPVLCAMILWLVYVIVWGARWAENLQAQQLSTLAFIVYGLVILLGLVILALCAGMIKSFNLSLGALKASVDLDDDDSPPSQVSSPPTAGSNEDTAGG